jgi:hypothetical protein
MHESGRQPQAGSGAGLVGWGACGWRSGMPAPSGQIPPPWARWEHEAPAARAACCSAQAAGLADLFPVGLHSPAVRVEALEGHVARLVPALQDRYPVGFHPGQQRHHGAGVGKLEPEMHEGREPLRGVARVQGPIAIQRALGRLVGLQEGELRRLVRISYAKVAEFQRRGAIHFHAVIRLDAATECRCPSCLAPLPEPFTATLLEDALRMAVPSVRVPCPSVDGEPGRYARWGEQLDVRNITTGDDQAGELSAEQVAGYIAKYATKATESFGSGLDRRLTADDLDRIDKLPAHVGELVRACWELGGRPELEGLRLRAWAHMLGFGGHWSTKSRRYSTTFTVLRRARVAFAKRRRARDGIPLDAWGWPEDDQAVVVVASWVYVGAGYETEGERWLALSAAARARERRRIAREELTTTTASAAVA